MAEMTEKQAEEFKRLDRAVDAFAAAMKARLLQKVLEGYEGWDDPENFPPGNLRRAMYLDARHVEYLNGSDAFEVTAQLKVDIANRAMMLWHRMQ